MKKLYWFVLLGLLLGCGEEASPTATAVPPSTQLPNEEAVAEAEVAPTETAVPPDPTETPIPPTPLPTETAVPPTDTAPPAAPDVPDLVWLPYATGNFGQPVLMMEDDEVALQPLPVDVEIFFDYEAGWLAYGSAFWEPTTTGDSVTDLRIYDFATEQDVLWAERVGRAELSPVNAVTNPPRVAVAQHRADGFDLLILLGPDSSIPLAQNIDPYFSWSPDGDEIAYLRGDELFITRAVGGDASRAPIASGLYSDSNWLGDAPVWLGSSGYMLFADAPFTVVATDGSETIVPTTVAGEALQGPRPYAMLYSPTMNQLIAESEGMFGPSVVVYQLGDGFETAELVQQIDDAQLAGWYEENESVIIVSSGEPTILPLTPQE